MAVRRDGGNPTDHRAQHFTEEDYGATSPRAPKTGRPQRPRATLLSWHRSCVRACAPDRAASVEETPGYNWPNWSNILTKNNHGWRNVLILQLNKKTILGSQRSELHTQEIVEVLYLDSIYSTSTLSLDTRNALHRPPTAYSIYSISYQILHILSSSIYPMSYQKDMGLRTKLFDDFLRFVLYRAKIE